MKDSHKAWPGVLKARLKVLGAQLEVLEALLKTMSLNELGAWLALLNVPEDRLEDKWALKALLKAPVALL